MIYVNQAQRPRQSITKRSASGQSRNIFGQQQINHQLIPIRQELIYKKSCDDLRNKIKTFSQLVRCNIILFGPSGSGKSSLIRTFNSSLNSTQNIPEILNIKDFFHNEGTQYYSNVTIQESKKNLIQSKNKSFTIQTCSINLMDTRGQIHLSHKENKQIELMLDGKVKNMSLVEQRTFRYAYKLWEFWKQDNELFPQSIINNANNIPHQVILVFDGSLDSVPNGNEEIEFYNQIIHLLKKKGYNHPFIILTQLDKLERKFKQHSDYLSYQDQRIESIVKSLHIPREQVFFIENYHGQMQNQELDYQALRILFSCLEQATKFEIRSVECNFF